MLDSDMDVNPLGGPMRASNPDYNPTTDAQALWLCCSDDGVATSGKCSSLTSRVGGYVFDNAFSSNRLTCNTALISGHQVLEQPNTAQAAGRQLFLLNAGVVGQFNGSANHTVAVYIRRDNPDVNLQDWMQITCTAGGAPVGGFLSWSNPSAVVTTGTRYTRVGASGAPATTYTPAYTRPTATWNLEAWTYFGSTGAVRFYRDGVFHSEIAGTARTPNLLDQAILGNQNSSAQGLVYYGMWFATKTALSAAQHSQLDAWVSSNLWS